MSDRSLAGHVLALLVIFVVPGAADAQGVDTAPALRAHHLTLSGGMVWAAGYPIGDALAELRGNGVGPAAPPFTLFRAASSIDAAAGLETRVGFAVTRALSAEVGVSYSRPGVTTELSQDEEAAAVTLDAEQLSQYVIDAGAVWQVPRIRLGTRMRPFILAGGGYLRQLYDDRTLVETGSVYYAGGGVRYWLRGGEGGRRSVGVRADVRAQWRRNGVEFEGQTRVAPVFSLHAFVEF